MRALLRGIVLMLLSSASAFAAAPRPGHLIVESNSRGASVIVDGKRVGVTPYLSPEMLALGEHTIKVSKPGFAPNIDVFTITRGRGTRIQVEMIPIAAVLYVNSNVANARVFVDGKFVGEAPLAGVEIEPGQRSIKVQRGGYRDYLKSVDGVAGQEIVLDAQIDELPLGLNPYKPLPPPRAKWFEKWWVWTAAVGGAAIVVTAIVVPIVVLGKNQVNAFGPDVQFSVP